MRSFLSAVLLVILGVACPADSPPAGVALPAIETIIIGPVMMENISIWVPAAKSGPFINRSCRIQKDLAFSSVLPASVKHHKTGSCPGPIARILAELASFFHSQSLPLTIFNGWQWEYSYSLCQYESVHYDLAQRGGCWENSWEAILNLTWGAIQLQPIAIESPERFRRLEVMASESVIEIKTFSSMRTRNGYPKERQL